MTQLAGIINSQGRQRLEAAIDAAIETGVRAQDYSTDEDAETPTTFREGTMVETLAVGRHQIGCTRVGCRCKPGTRPDPISDKACEDAAALRTALATIGRLQAEYLTVAGKVPAKSPVPADRCVVCWAAGISKRKAPGRARCYPCQTFHDRYRKDHPDADYPPVVLAVHREVAASLAGSGMRRATADAQAWDHPRVHRAWAATGWHSVPGDRWPVGPISA